jgi:type I restriction enzyme R subunit
MSKSGLFRESVVEEAALEWYAQQGYATLSGADIAPGEPGGERASYADVVLNGPKGSTRRSAGSRVISRPSSSTPTTSCTLPRERRERRVPAPRRHDRVRPRAVVDFDTPGEQRLAGRQPAHRDRGRPHRRPDIVVFVNGLPLAVIELKNAADESATIWDAFQQLQTYKHELPGALRVQRAAGRLDGLEARIGTLSSNRSASCPGAPSRARTLAPATARQLEVLIRGVFEPRRFLDLLRYFIVFEDDGRDGGQEGRRLPPVPRGGPGRRGHRRGLAPQGDRRVGVVWHTQGSGKSLTMAFYAGRVVLHPAMENPTLVVLTDRNDLDDQLFGTFSRCSDLLRQPRAGGPRHLRELLQVASGGVVFTTIQKFLPESGRRVPAALRPPQHRGHRRRGAPQPVRLHRRLRAPHARRAARTPRSSASPARRSS